MDAGNAEVGTIAETVIFLGYSNELPAHDHLSDILVSLDAERSQACIVAWVARLGALC